MEEFYLQISDLAVKIRSRYPYTQKLCKDYLVQACNADLTAQATEEEIAADSAELGGSHPYAESISLYRSIAEQLPARNRMVCHGAAIEYAGKGYLFTALSGTGKSTHISLWSRYLGKKVAIINGDKPILRCSSDGARIYGTPWAGKEGWQKNCSAPLAAVCLLRRSDENRIEKVDAADYLDEVFQQVYLPHGAEALANTLELTDRMLRLVPFYLLYCNMTEEAVQVSFEALTGENYHKATKGEDK